MKIKETILVLLIAVFASNSLCAQAPKSFKFQALLSSSTNALATDKTFLIEVLQGSLTGVVVFEESHTLSVPESGLITLNIGSVNNLGSVAWATDSFFLRITVDGELLGVSPIIGVPIAENVATADNIREIVGYNSLDNLPTLGITTDESDKIDLLEITSELDLDQLSTDVTTNSAKTSFPGFGTTAGTAFIQKWSKIDNDLFFFGGKAAINKTLPLDFAGSTLDLGAGLLLDRMTPSEPTPGMLFFDDATGEYQYHNNLGNPVNLFGPTPVFASGVITDSHPETDLTVSGSLSVGNSAEQGIGQEPEGTLNLVSDNLRIRFNDTSNSASFPTNDWEITVNDQMEGGDDYFAITDISAGNRPFCISAGATERIVTVDQEGRVGIKVEEPTERLDMGGQSLMATSFTGDASQLTGLNGMGSSSETNPGSTTLASDSDGNEVGDLQFQTAGADRLTVFSSGKVGIGTGESGSHLLAVGGSLSTNTIVSEGNTTLGSISNKIIVDPALSGFSLDVTDGNVYIIESGIGSLVSLLAGVPGQRITIINKNSSSFTVFFSSSTLAVGQYESVTFETSDGSDWFVVRKS